MEKTSILDFVTRISALAGKQKNDNQSQTKPTAKQNDNANAKTQNLEQNGDFNATEKSENASGFSQNKNSYLPESNNSFMKAYNPFGDLQKNKPQLNMPKAPRPTKNRIDLSSSKNLATNGVSEPSKNVIDLINRHNAFSAKIKRD